MTAISGYTSPVVWLAAALLAGSACTGSPDAGAKAAEQDAEKIAEETSTETPPHGVEQLLPRGGIPAIFEPSFVAASQADLPDDAWVLGVVVEGVPKAYGLNLLNRHEVVNDRSGGTAFAAVW